jgi:hypothetical protein
VRSARSVAPRLNGILLLPAAAVVVHQLRYWLAYGSRANAELAAQGHSYLSSLVPWTIGAVALGAGLYLRRAAHAFHTGRASSTRGLPAAALWLATSVSLLAIYAVQEALEAMLATGHPGGIGGVFGHGGWWALPVAAVIGALVTAVLLVGRAILRVTASARRFELARAERVLLFPVAAEFAVVRPLARAAAGRAPPSSLPAR